MRNLKEIFDAFGNEERFAMISLSVDADPAAPKKYGRDEGIAWTQGFLGEWSKDDVTKKYGVFGIPAIFLIDPEGNILATDLRGAHMKEVVAAGLGK